MTHVQCSSSIASYHSIASDKFVAVFRNGAKPQWNAPCCFVHQIYESRIFHRLEFLKFLNRTLLLFYSELFAHFMSIYFTYELGHVYSWKKFEKKLDQIHCEMFAHSMNLTISKGV